MSFSDGQVERTAKSRARRARRSAPKMRVLAVDDEPSILELLQTALNALGDFEVSIASSGDDALRQMERVDKPFDCLLLDIQMPQMNGIDLCRSIRQMRTYRSTPIIMLTAMSERKYIDESFVAGATDYVTKPFDFFELRSRLSAAQRLVREHARASDSIEVARKLKQELDANLQFSLEDPVSIPDIERILGFTEFENYVVRLSQGKRFTSYVSAIQVVDAPHHHATLSSSDFREGLHDVSRALSKMTKKTGNILSYRGNGVFLCVSHGRGTVPTQDIAPQLNKLIATMQASRQMTFRFEVAFGEAVSMRLTSKSGALYSLTRAIEALHAPEEIPPNGAGAEGRRLTKGRGVGSDTAHLERRAYESILKDLLKEEPSLNSY